MGVETQTSPSLQPQNMSGHYEQHQRPSRPRRRYTTDAPSSPSKTAVVSSSANAIKLPSALNDLLPPAAKAAETTGNRSRSVSSERLDTALQQTGTPSSNTTIDVRELGTKGFALKIAVLALLHEMFPETWNDIADANGLEVERVSGAMTNCVFIVSSMPSAAQSSSKKVLLRVYGTGVEEFIEREHELVWMSRLSDMNVGPKLLGVFANGRFEEFREFLSRLSCYSDSPFLTIINQWTAPRSVKSPCENRPYHAK